ncbi:MAG: hypothetical protein ACQGVK_24475 [Myxococcota bacterium]
MPDEPIFLTTDTPPDSPDPRAPGGPRPGPEALKELSATALERGLGFVEGAGDEYALLRAHVVLEARPAGDVAEWLADRQDPAGSWSRRSIDLCEALGFESPEAWGDELAGTLSALATLGATRQLHVEPARRAEAWLRAAQNADGSWGPTSLPPSERLYLTGSLAGLLGRTDYVRPPVLESAGEFLATLWSPEAVEGGRWSALAAFAHFFTNVHHDLSDEALQWCGRELERGFRTRRFDALLTARVLLDCDAAALPAFGVAPEEMVAALAREQAGDGGFAELAAGGPGVRVDATIDGLRALIALNRAF